MAVSIAAGDKRQGQKEEEDNVAAAATDNNLQEASGKKGQQQHETNTNKWTKYTFIFTALRKNMDPLLHFTWQQALLEEISIYTPA